MSKKIRRTMSSLSEVIAPDPKFWTKTSWLQLGYGIWVNMTVMGIGLSFGFPAVTIPQLRERDSPIQVTMSEEAWIASILTLSSPIGSILCGILMDSYGRKIVLVLCEIPMCFGWFYMASAQTAKDIIVGRVIAGVGLGMAITAPRAYITEITLPNMRGVIGALPNLFISLGLTIQAGFGSFLKWNTLCYMCGFYTIIMLVANIFLPDTPYFLLLHATPSNARVNLRRFRSSKFNVDAELEALRDFRKDNNIRSLSLKGQIKAMFKPSSCKPFGIATVYIMFMQLSGVNVVIMWAIEILNTAQSSLDANMGNFILALTRIAIGVLTSILLFKTGRRVMAMVSAIGVGVVAIAFCIFLYMSNEQSIFPQLIFMAYIGFATLGYYTLPFLMMFELLPLQIRGLLSGICISSLNLMMFGMNKSYPFMRESFGLANTMAMFGVFSLIGALVLYFILPETKDLTLQEIEEFFNSRRSTLVSQRIVMSDQLNETSKNMLAPNQNKRKSFDLRDKKEFKSKIELESRDKDSKYREKDLKDKELKEKTSSVSFTVDKDLRNKASTVSFSIDKDLKTKAFSDKDSVDTSLTNKDSVEKNLKDKVSFDLSNDRKDKIVMEQELKNKDSKDKDLNEKDSKDKVLKEKDSKDKKDEKDKDGEKDHKRTNTGIVLKDSDED